ncbi:MAG: hypothetical protein F2663_03080 [Actinobacteria bacterium]|uniref:Unannotated protein n=1 Tax=freshwater metagenome TaxID=449393 RepID=A0A6J6NT26_9ZZZZ|nr:hypothetical protein [Actinomycetota bacterium]
MSTIVLKVGGAVAARSAQAVLELAKEHSVCVVHGAGPQISAEMEAAGVPVQFIGGRRVTTADGIKIVRSSLVAVNTALAEAIGDQAVALHGDEIGLQARQVEELGLVGDPQPSRPQAVIDALAAGKIPVVMPLAEGPLNVNADDAAAALAVGLGVDELRFLTDVEGFMLDGVVLDSLDATEAEALMAGGTLDPTILPKLGAAVIAAKGGVNAAIGRTIIAATGVAA